MDSDKTECYLTEKEVSKLTGLALQTLRNARCQGKLFPYVKIGRAVRYPSKEIHEVMENHRVEVVE